MVITVRHRVTEKEKILTVNSCWTAKTLQRRGRVSGGAAHNVGNTRVGPPQNQVREHVSDSLETLVVDLGVACVVLGVCPAVDDCLQWLSLGYQTTRVLRTDQWVPK